MTHTVLDQLPLWQMGLMLLCFVWSGIVRSGLGFGGAALSLPLLLMFVDDPLLFLPATSFHLLFFSVLTVATRMHNVNWRFLWRLSALLFVPFVAGLVGLLNLPGPVLTVLVYSMTFVYGISYALDRAFAGNNNWADGFFLALGGYVSGLSLIGAPLIMAAAGRRIAAWQMRDTFFVLWIVMVLFKLGTFVATDVNLQWRLTLLTFPMVAIGHFIGLQFHNKLVKSGISTFRRVIGLGLLLVSVFGIVNVLDKLL